MSGPDVETRALKIARQHIDMAAGDVDRNPSDAAKLAGNYTKGHLVWRGLDITLDNPTGSKRSGVDPKGKPWSVQMPAHYGYLKRSRGADGDHVDIYMGPHPLSHLVFVVDQVDHKSQRFDEHKVMLGFDTASSAIDTYEKAFSDGKGHARIGGLMQMTVEQFKKWLKSGDTTKRLT